MSESSISRLTRRVTAMDWRTALMIVVALLGVGVLVLLLANLRTADVQRQAALARQSDSYEIMVLAQGFAATAARAEATLGRYVVAGERAVGRDYVEEWNRAGRQLGVLQRRVQGNRDQAARSARLRQAYDARGLELAEVAQNTNFGRNEAAYAYFNEARRSPHLAALSRETGAIFDNERALLRRHTDQTRITAIDAAAETRNLAIFGVLLAFGAIALGWLNLRAIRDRAAAAAEADAQRARSVELEAAVAAATAGLQAEARERIAAEEKLRQVQKMEAVGQLTGGIAHDFNNMLAVVLGGLELARRNLPDGATDALRHLDNAGEGANRAAALTRQLLGFARSEALTPEAIEPTELVAGMSVLLDRTLGDGITIETRSEGTRWHVWADRVQLENALLNLAVNARDAMDGRGTMVIASGHVALDGETDGDCAPGDYVSIAVSDTGTGMTPEVMNRVFEPFFTTKPVGKGTGLGLSQIFGFVRQSGGAVRIESTLGAGTTVTMLLPCHAADAVAATAPERVAPRAQLDRGLDILLVEDDPRVLSATLAALEELGHRPIACPDPLAAPRIVAGLRALDLIMTDVLMPGQTGPEMIAGLEPQLDRVAVLYVTGYAGEAEQDRFAGRPVLRKPFTLVALEQALADAIASQAPADTVTP
ncbi:response regulator [Sphingomonas sp. R647]|uniref:ATP-binding protein n=1 Tax=Sphingomonas sp. R647 TaxID=2875233 RepID=UPI001CD5DB1F|nr:ATP-binding protein [Sphingomonas sp. R647]MCA1199984.1 response regulator [Sphingomonas sp. R647]